MAATVVGEWVLLLRLFFRWGFHTVVRSIMGDLGGIRDSQCGLKLMTLSAAERFYSHDVEVLYPASPQYVDQTTIEKLNDDDDNNRNINRWREYLWQKHPLRGKIKRDRNWYPHRAVC